MKKLNIEYKKKLLETVAFSYGQISLYELVQKEHRHFHPSGKCNASKSDKQVTERIEQAGELLGIPLLDHIILGAGGDYYSMAEHGLIKERSGCDWNLR